jgi:hypothetical protein
MRVQRKEGLRPEHDLELIRAELVEPEIVRLSGREHGVITPRAAADRTGPIHDEQVPAEPRALDEARMVDVSSAGRQEPDERQNKERRLAHGVVGPQKLKRAVNRKLRTA